MSPVILPNSGLMRNGVCSPRPPLRPIGANGSGLWPCAQACNSLQSGVDHNKVNRGHGPSLVDRALMADAAGERGFRRTDPPHGTGGPSLRQAATTVVRGFQGSAWQQAAH